MQTRALAAAAAGERGRRRLPPGPPGYPLLGNLPAMRGDPLGFFLTCARRYGDVVRLRLPAPLGASYLINHPEGVRRVLQDNQHNYSRDVFSYHLLATLTGNGLVTSEGPFWQRQRRLMQPAFHRRHVAAFVGLMGEATAALLQEWDDRTGGERTMDVAAEMTRLTFEIVGRALFGLDLGSEVRVVGHAATVLNDALSAHFFLPFPPLWAPTPGNRRRMAAQSALDAIVFRIIRERRRQDAPGDDLLGLLVQARDDETGEGMDDRQLRDEVITLLLAGHETTANALTWAWYLLARHEPVARRLRAELDAALGGRAPTSDDLPNLPYTRAVIEETMRLYPPAWSFSRRAVAADELCGYAVPAGTTVYLSPYTMHRHPAYWDEPERFAPERFIAGQAVERPRYAYYPFGGGQHLCIGNGFALTEAQVVLATIAQRYRLEPASGRAAVPAPLITLRARGGMPLRVRRR